MRAKGAALGQRVRGDQVYQFLCIALLLRELATPGPRANTAYELLPSVGFLTQHASPG